MNTKITSIETSMTPDELENKLNLITVKDFADYQNFPKAQYYGEINDKAFNIKNVRYGPMSSVPFIEGEISGDSTHSVVHLKIDIESHSKMVQKMYYSTLIPIGIIVMLLSILVFAGTDYQLQGFIFAGAFIVCAFAFVAIMKASLSNMRNKEINKFISTVHGRDITDELSNENKQSISKAA